MRFKKNVFVVFLDLNLAYRVKFYALYYFHKKYKNFWNEVFMNSKILVQSDQILFGNNEKLLNCLKSSSNNILKGPQLNYRILPNYIV